MKFYSQTWYIFEAKRNTMKKNLSFLLLLVPSIFFAQNWMPVVPGETYNYRLQDSAYITQTIRVDSMKKVGNDSVFYLNRVLQWFVFPGDPILGIDTLAIGFQNQGQFLGQTMTKTPNGDLVFHAENVFFDTTFIIRPFANVGETWLAVPDENITATIVSVTQGDVLGEPDSLKTIQFDNGATWVLSKQHGLVQCPDFYTNNLRANLSGLEAKGLGDRLYRFDDFFDFNVGDVLEYSSYSSGLWGSRNQIFKRTILEKSVTPDTFHYTVRQITKTTSVGWNSGTTYEDKIISVDYSRSEYSKLASYNQQLISLSSSLWFSHTDFSYASFFEHGIRLGRKSSPFGQPIFCSVLKVPKDHNDPAFGLPDGLGCGSGALSEAIQYYEEFRPLLGKVGLTVSVVDNFYSEWLTGAIIQGDTVWGSISPDWLFTSVEETNKDKTPLKLYPNPAQDFVLVECSECANNPYTVEIFGAENKLFHAVETTGQAATQRIDLTGLPTGFYFIIVRWKGGTGQGKMVKTN